MSAVLVPKEISLLVSSDTASGAFNVSSDGSRFSINLEGGLVIPNDALNLTLVVESSSVWYVTPNILTGVNDSFEVKGFSASDVLTEYTVTIPQGLYDLTSLSASILRNLELQDAKIDPLPLISFSSDVATQKVILRLNYTNVSVDFAVANTPRLILGYDSKVIGPLAGAPEDVEADNAAAFNTVNSFLIHSDLTNKGIRVNSTYNQSISQVLIDASPGSLLNHSDRHPPKIDAQELAGSNRSNFNFWLTDENNNAVDTAGEAWGARLAIRWLQPHVVDRLHK